MKGARLTQANKRITIRQLRPGMEVSLELGIDQGGLAVLGGQVRTQGEGAPRPK